MEKTVLYEIKGLYRDDFRVTGYSFGEGEKAICIVGATRGNEYQQLYSCSQLVKRLKELEENGKLVPGKKILVVPSVNPYSMNVKKRFWTIDNTDINRMFPGYDLGETTQRIAAGVFEAIKGYKFGVQYTSFYMTGDFVPHIRLMKTGFENVEQAKHFGLPYVIVRNPRPFDTTTLNYNWQIWETDAFSIYTTTTSSIDKVSAQQSVEAILNFMSINGIVEYRGNRGYISRVISDEDILTIRSEKAGFFEAKVRAGDYVRKGLTLAHIHHPYDGSKSCEIKAPESGVIAFLHNEPMTYTNTAIIKLIREDK